MLLTALLLAQYAGTLDLSETSRLDARVSEPLPVLQNPPREIAIASDATFSPLARIRLSDHRWDWMFIYNPTFNVTDIELGPEAEPVVVNAGTISAAWHDRRVRIAVSESASYGVEDLGYLYATPVAGQTAATQTGTGTQTGTQTPGQTSTPGQTAGQAGATTQGVGQTGVNQVSPSTTFPFGSSSTNVTLTVRANQHLSVSVSGGYALSGSLTTNPEAANVYPEQYGPLGSVNVSYAPSALDTWVTTASAQNTTTPLGACVPIVVGKYCKQDVPDVLLQETLRHTLTATSSVGATLGVSATVYALDDGTALGILPVGGVYYTQRLGAPVKDPRGSVDPTSVRLSADLVPTVNVFTGLPSNRIQLAATWSDHISNKVGLSFTAGLLQTVPLPDPDPSPLTLISGGIELKVRLTRLITASAGIQGFWQDQQNAGALPTATTTTGATTTTAGAAVPTTSGTEVGYVALTARLPTMRL